MTEELFLRDVIEIPESVHAGDFKVELVGGFTDSARRVEEYVVTDQLRQAFGKALSIVKAALRDGSSHAAYLHGSFGSGKSHFLTVLHAILNEDPAARAKPGLQSVIADHDDWLRGRRFLMVPYHLVGAADVGSAILGGYVATVRRLHPDRPTPPVYRADALLEVAAGQRAFLADDARFAMWLGGAATDTVDGDDDDLDPIDEAPAAGWTTADLDRAFAAAAGEPVRDALVSALLSGPLAAHARGVMGDAEAFIPFENGLAAIARHAKDLGYDGLVLFLDELILWLQSHMTDREFTDTQVGSLVKLIESGEAGRALPIVSFISRQRDLSQLVGADVTGADVKNLEAQVQYLAARFDVVHLEDRNLPAIIKERVLRAKSPSARAALDEAFRGVESANAATRDVLLDASGATGATWQDFREVYPLSPALLNVLVALSGALQRQRTGLKLLQEMLFRRRADLKLGQLIPLGDLWDVLSDGTGEAFTDRLRREAEAAQRFYAKARARLLDKYGSDTDERFIADDRFVKTLLLAALTPDVPALARLTGARLAALNHGSIRSRVSTPGQLVIRRLRELQADFGELRAEGEEDPVFTLHLTDLDVEPLLEAVGEQDSLGARRIWVKDQLWQAFGVRDGGEFVCEREVVWRGTRRTVELVFANVRDPGDLPDAQFAPGSGDRVRVVLDYPFDLPAHYPSDDALRVDQLRRKGFEAATVVWLPDFLSDQRRAQLGRLLKIHYLLERDRLADYASHLGADDQVRVRHQLQAQRDTLTSQLGAVLRQLYGIAGGEESNVASGVGDEGHLLTFLPGPPPRPLAGAGFDQNLLAMADWLYGKIFTKHPDLDPAGSRKAVTLGELKTVYGWISRAVELGGRRIEVDKAQLLLVKRVVHALELGEVTDGPLNLSTEWQRRLDQQAAQHGATGDYAVEDLRRWIAELGWKGLEPPVANLIVGSYALLSDRAWIYRGIPEPNGPELDRMGPGWALRAQDLPSAQEFTTARRRAADLFGLNVPDALFARNVNRLAADVTKQVEALEAPLHALRQSLTRHADALGLQPGAADPRTVSTRDAEELLARLRAAREATPLVQTLAAATHATGDVILAATLKSAPDNVRALDTVDWSLLESVRRFTDRDDTLGEQAARLLHDVTATARADEYDRRLAPVLTQVRQRAVQVINEAARLAAVAATTPSTAPADPGHELGASRAGQISLTDLGNPPVPSTPPAAATPDQRPGTPGAAQPAHSRRVRASVFESALESLVRQFAEEIRILGKSDPDLEVEISLRVIHPQTATDGYGQPGERPAADEGAAG